MSHNKTKSSIEVDSGISEQMLNDRIANLTDEMTPERDLWSGIERAISQRNQEVEKNNAKSNVLPIAWAASFVAAILLSWFTFAPLEHQDVQKNRPQHLVTTPAATEQLVSYMQTTFQQQKKAMLVSFGQPDLAKLPAAMQKELQQLAAARESIRQALLKDENNVDLLNLLDFTQQQELKLLTQLYQPYQMI